MIETYRQGIEFVAEGPVIPTGDATTVSVQAWTIDATWGTAVLEVKRSNSPSGPFLSFGTPVTMNAVGFTSAIDVTNVGYIRVDVTTAEGANETLGIAVCLKQP